MDEKRRYEDGIHVIGNTDYHSSSGVSRSALMEFKRSPYHYHHKYLCDNHDISEPSTAMILGNLIHTMILEPHKFDEEFVLRPNMDRRTNAGKQMFGQFTATLAGRTGITYEQLEQAESISKAVKSDKLARTLLEDCKIEQSIYFTHGVTGIQCKVRPDAWNGSIVIDLKTTQDASYRAFQRSAFNYGYFLQAGMIDAALFHQNIALEKFIFIVVEKEAPYAVAVYTLDEEAIAYGAGQFDRLISSYAACHKNNLWPGFGVQSLSVPNYANYEIETEYEHE